MNNYEEYLKRENSAIPAINLEILEKGKDIAFGEILKFESKNKLLQKGYLSNENGFYHFEDRSAYAAVLTKMPNVTIEMIDWWFWWHPKEPIRYKIWYPEMHYNTSADFGGFYDDNTKSYRERLQLSTHYVDEDIGTGRAKIAIKFMSPEEFGFDKHKLKNDKEESIICAKVGDLGKRVWHTQMCHAVRKVDKGVEMRSRFWMAKKVERMDKFGQNILNTFLNNSYVKKKLLPVNLGKYMFHHCTQEYNNLGDILPEIYKKEKAYLEM